MFKKISKLFSRNQSNSHDLPPPTKAEQGLIDELRNKFKEIPYRNLDNLTPAEKAWAENINTLKDNVQQEDPRSFLNWRVIKDTMFVDLDWSYKHFVEHEFLHVTKSHHFDSRWKNAIQESNVGSPVTSHLINESSANLIHHAYHALIFEEKTGRKIDKDYGLILEFGGGYGSLCRLAHNIGYNKKYIIFDLAPFTLLQTYYLKSLGLNVLNPQEFLKADNGILCISDKESLKQILDVVDAHDKLFIATWSLSETSIAVRNEFLALIRDFNGCLIAYQHEFGEVNNVEYFDALNRYMKCDHWQNWEISQLQGSYYLLGSSK